MSFSNFNSSQESQKVIAFIKQTYSRQNKTKGVIAVSGGIDSAVSLTLLTKALSPDQALPVFLPSGEQSVADSRAIVKFNKIPKENWQEINIKPIVDQAQKLLGVSEKDKVRLGNLKARARMMVIYDLAKANNALVCGTENKSEKYLGYFTRFGDEASDLEPIVHLYKTQVRHLAKFLQLPKQFLSKAPSADLWAGQTDEQELGFSYVEADQVLHELVDLKKDPAQIEIEGVKAETVQKVLALVRKMEFKHLVPYQYEK